MEAIPCGEEETTSALDMLSLKYQHHLEVEQVGKERGDVGPKLRIEGGLEIN